ncbi:hypothetical protein [Candidatus Thiodictyon syntrophicum]|jgi:hypothetical protein|uniref:hypothetical protein n=1 Tax=Candidatus Thiodictyon syntrophicum TaxID=1166950 RepID=UPI0012FE14AA|nr:hypothetical protein [Candidatus Thiodictyon syntrophicum]
MSYTFQDFRRDLARETLPELTPEERLRGLPPEEVLRGLSDEDADRLKELLERRKSGRP